MNPLLWSVNPPHAKCFVAANPTIELASIRRGRVEVPVISLAYALHDLAAVSPFFGLVQKWNGRPTIYLINGQGLNPEILVSFNVYNLSRRIFRHVYDEGLIDEYVKRNTKIEALTTASAAVEGYVFRRFLGNFSRSQKVEVVVSEKPTQMSDTLFNPVATFTVHHFVRTSPEVRLY